MTEHHHLAPATVDPIIPNAFNFLNWVTMFSAVRYAPQRRVITLGSHHKSVSPSIDEKYVSGPS
jgi:hypothetical protein